MTPGRGLPRSVLITGAAGGIGRLTVERFAAAGWTVFASDRALDGLPRGERIVPIVLDVTSDASVAAARAQLGVPDVIVNNAGVGLMGPITEMRDEDLQRMFDVNVLGPTRVARAFVPPMAARGSGRIVNVGSLAGICTIPFLGGYCASKHAVEAVTDAMRLELQPLGIGVSLVQPAVVNTGFVDRALASLNGCAAGSASWRAPLQRTAALRATLARTELHPRTVADAVFRAATHRWPRARYPVGTLTVFLIRLMHLLPTFVSDAVLRSALRLGAPPALNPGVRATS